MIDGPDQLHECAHGGYCQACIDNRQYRHCSCCGGAGVVYLYNPDEDKLCEECHGDGWVLREKSVL